MNANNYDEEIAKHLPLLSDNEKNSLLTLIKYFLRRNTISKYSIDYTKYRFPVDAIKYDKGQINER